MSNLVSSLDFELMALWFKLRDLLEPPQNILAEVGIEPGFQVLDYGCGPGSHSLIAAQLVGDSGKVFAVDVNPLALQRVRRLATDKKLANIETIQTDCATGLGEGTIDVVLFYDTYHGLEHPDAVLGELYRVLKPGSLLAFSDHHLQEDQILDRLTRSGLFRMVAKGAKTHTFAKAI